MYSLTGKRKTLRWTLTGKRKTDKPKTTRRWTVMAEVEEMRLLNPLHRTAPDERNIVAGLCRSRGVED